MKKLVLTTACALAVTGAAFAQGTVSFSTISPAAMTAQTNSTTYSPLFGGGSTGSGAVGATGTAYAGFYYELLYTTYSGSGALPTIPNLTSLLAWNDTGLGATNASSAGHLVPIAGSTDATVPWAAGTTDSIVLVGWSADLGTTWGVVSNELAHSSYAAVLAGQQGFFGVSTTGFIAAGGANPGATVFNNAPVVGTGTPIFSVNTPLFLLPVPEPTTLALAGLGGLSLLLFRRQRK